MSKEISFVASVLDPLQKDKAASMKHLEDVDQLTLRNTLRKNKVVVSFEKNLETMGPWKDVFFGKFHTLETFYENVHAKIDEDLQEFGRIKDSFSKDNVEFLLIKSDGSFPHESDNIDILIRPEKLGMVARLLKEAGYSEIPRVRESHKFLFRNTNAFKVLPLHIHTRVEWEGTQFIDSRDLWGKSGISRISRGNGGFSIPSPEDCILITAAHLFFEDHEIKLADLLKIDSRIRNFNIDWDYVFERASRFHWNDAFRLTMFQLDQLCDSFYERSMLKEGTLSRMEELDHRWDRLFRKIMVPSDPAWTLLKIPYPVAGFFFLRKVLDDSNSNITERLRHLGLISCDVIKRNTINRDPSMKKRYL